MYKVVIDTNLLINGSRDDYNYGNRIIEEVISGKLAAYANRATLRENILLSSKKITDEQYLKKLEQFFNRVNVVDSTAFHIQACEDPEDNKLLESAAAAGADYLITSDKHLLKLEKFRDSKIFSPGQFINFFAEETGSSWSSWLETFIKP